MIKPEEDLYILISHRSMFKGIDWLLSPIAYVDMVVSFIIYLLYLVYCCTFPDKHGVSHGMCIYQVMVTLYFLSAVAYDAESTQISKITSKSLVWRVNLLVGW